MAQELGERLFYLEARIEGIFPLVAGDPEGPPDWLEDFCEDADSASKSVFERFPHLAKFIATGDETEPAAVAEALCLYTTPGFVCKIQWCPRRYLDGGSFMSGWGWTTWRWVYGETAEAAIENALQAAEQHHEQSRTKPAA